MTTCTYTVYDNKTDELVILDGTAEECAEAMRISVSSFYSYLCKSKKDKIHWYIDAVKRPMTRQRQKRIKQTAKLKSKGVKMCEIAKRYGVTTQTVRNDLIAYGDSDLLNYGAKTRVVIEEYRKNPNRTQRSIARELGFSQQLVSATIKKYCR